MHCINIYRVIPFSAPVLSRQTVPLTIDLFFDFDWLMWIAAILTDSGKSI